MHISFRSTSQKSKRHVSFVFCTLCLLLSSFASESFAKPESGWQVLGINKQKKWIAYRDVYVNFDAELGEPVDCKYPDIQEGYGVQFGIWSIDENKTIQTWNVYESVFEKENCTSSADAKKNIKKAKAYLSRNGIDISTPLSGISKTSENTYPIPGPTRKIHPFELVAFQELPIPGEEAMGGYLLKRWIRNADSEVVYEKEEYGVKAMASSLSIEYPKAFVLGDSVVFLEVFQSSSMRHFETKHSFTPAIKIK